MDGGSADRQDGGHDLVGPFREFLDRRLPAERRRDLLGNGGWDPAFMSELRDMGWVELALPPADGGLGVGLPDLRELVELVGERLVPGPLAEQLVLAALLPAAVGAGGRPAGGRLLALADPGVSTGWVADLGGLRWCGGVLDGSVELVRFGAQAEAVVLAVDGGPAGAGSASGEAALVVLPADDPAVTIEPAPSGDPAAQYARVTVRGARPAGRDVLATGAEATELLVRVRAWMRLYTACEMAGIARRVLADTVAYVRGREQFGRPIGSFQAVKHLLASMAQHSLSLDALCEAAVADAAGQDGPDLELTAYAAKAHAAQRGPQVCEDALQAHGGIGFTTECDLHWYLRRALALRSWYGDERELMTLIGGRRLAGPVPAGPDRRTPTPRAPGSGATATMAR